MLQFSDGKVKFKVCKVQTLLFLWVLNLCLCTCHQAKKKVQKKSFLVDFNHIDSYQITRR